MERMDLIKGSNQDGCQTFAVPPLDVLCMLVSERKSHLFLADSEGHVSYETQTEAALQCN